MRLDRKFKNLRNLKLLLDGEKAALRVPNLEKCLPVIEK